LAIWHCILSDEQKRTPSDLYFGDFAHWTWSFQDVVRMSQ